MSRCLAIIVLPVVAALLPAHAENPAAPLGKQRAAASPLEWESKEAGHPILGNIRFAYQKRVVETPVGNAKVYSRAYVSCQRDTRKFAIELTNTTAPDDPGGLQPSTMPKLICSRVDTPGKDKLVQEELWADWQVSKIGDALAKGFRAFTLRECVAIDVVQEVVMPPGSAAKTARVQFEIDPYSRELDSIFVSCGEESAYAPAAPATAPVVAAAPARLPAVPPAAAKLPATPLAPEKFPAAPPETNLQWLSARTIMGSHTNLRAGPALKSALVMQLDPGMDILVQRASADWWRAKPVSGAPFDGYIRQDRLIFK